MVLLVQPAQWETWDQQEPTVQMVLKEQLVQWVLKAQPALQELTV